MVEKRRTSWQRLFAMSLVLQEMTVLGASKVEYQNFVFGLNASYGLPTLTAMDSVVAHTSGNVRFILLEGENMDQAEGLTNLLNALRKQSEDRVVDVLHFNLKEVLQRQSEQVQETFNRYMRSTRNPFIAVRPVLAQIFQIELPFVKHFLWLDSDLVAEDDLTSPYTRWVTEYHNQSLIGTNFGFWSQGIYGKNPIEERFCGSGWNEEWFELPRWFGNRMMSGGVVFFNLEEWPFEQANSEHFLSHEAKFCFKNDETFYNAVLNTWRYLHHQNTAAFSILFNCRERRQQQALWTLQEIQNAREHIDLGNLKNRLGRILKMPNHLQYYNFGRLSDDEKILAFLLMNPDDETLLHSVAEGKVVIWHWDSETKPWVNLSKNPQRSLRETIADELAAPELTMAKKAWFSRLIHWLQDTSTGTESEKTNYTEAWRHNVSLEPSRGNTATF